MDREVQIPRLEVPSMKSSTGGPCRDASTWLVAITAYWLQQGARANLYCRLGLDVVGVHIFINIRLGFHDWPALLSPRLTKLLSVDQCTYHLDDELDLQSMLATSLLVTEREVTYPLAAGGLSSSHFWEKDNQDCPPNLWLVLMVQ